MEGGTEKRKKINRIVDMKDSRRAEQWNCGDTDTELEGSGLGRNKINDGNFTSLILGIDR